MCKVFGRVAILAPESVSFLDGFSPLAPCGDVPNKLYQISAFHDEDDPMKVLVAYMSSSGNTKKIAEAIYGEIAAEKEIKQVGEVEDIGAYDLSFLGFPTHGYGPDKKTRALLEKLCKDGRKVALFVTHGAPEDEPDVSQWMAKFKQAAAGANLVGFFDCQGELAKGVKFIMKISPNKEMRSQAKRDNSQGQPDEARIERARAFARGTLSQVV